MCVSVKAWQYMDYVCVCVQRMVALYNYDPHHVSPNPNPDAELTFHAGDVITVYGYMVS